MYKKINGFALVTGSARGLGAAMVRQLAKDGYDVVINYVSDSSKVKAEEIAEDVKKEYGVGAIVAHGDVSNYENCRKMVDAGIAAFGDKIAVLVNNAGLNNLKRFEDLTPVEYERIIRVELLGSMNCTHVVLPYMQKAQDGCIVFISSIAAINGVALECDYSAAKAGMNGFMRALAIENAENNIRLNSIAPGNINTEIFNNVPKDMLKALIQTIPMKRLGQPVDIAECLSYIINAKYMTGQVISPNGGMYMF